MVFLLIRQKMNILTQNIEYMQLWDAVFLFMPTILDAILIFDFFKQLIMQILNLHGLMNQKKTVTTTREVRFLLQIHVLN